MTDRVLEIIHPNTAMRSYAITKLFELPPEPYMLRETSEVPESIAPLFKWFWSQPSVKEISLSRGEIRIEATAAYEDDWSETGPMYAAEINKFFFNGEATVSQRDDRDRYSRSSRDDY